MTSIKSLFNFGIYKNILKRFKWGSFLYFILLFLSGPFAVLNDKYFYDLSRPEILTAGYMGFPTFLGIIVPTIVAVLCFRYVHSSKQGIFSHSLPVTRLENYTTTIIAGLTLMFAPIMLNAIIYGIMSVTAYSDIIPLWSVLLWMFANFAVTFIMFSFATFTAFLTGHTAAHIAINGLLHITPLVISVGIILVSELFLYGFAYSDHFIANLIAENTPFIWLFGNSVQISTDKFEFFFNLNMLFYIILAIAFYCLGYLLYKKRKIEACGDVAAFKAFRPILKYTATFFSAVLIFAMVAMSSLPAVSIFTISIIVTAIVYFASEMLIKKSLKVFKSYKGYLGFVLFMIITISLFAFTDTFGYEKRIPKPENIESSAIYVSFAENEPYVYDATHINNIRDIHKEIVSDIPVLEKKNAGYYARPLLIIKYDLKNEKTLEREYYVDPDFAQNAIKKAYESTEYKNKVFGFDTLNIENVYSLGMKTESRKFTYHSHLENDNAKKVLEAIKLDVSELSYDEITDNNFCWNISFDLSEDYEGNEKSKVFDESVYYLPYYRHQHIEDRIYRSYYSFEISINPNFKNTFNLLKELGYYDEIVSTFADSLYICKVPAYIEYNGIVNNNYRIKIKDDIGEANEFFINYEDCVKLPANEASILADSLANEPSSRYNYQYSEIGKYYMIFRNVDETNQRFEDHLAIYSEDNLPDYLLKYISE